MLEFHENRYVISELEQSKEDGDYDLMVEAFKSWWNEEYSTYGSYVYRYDPTCTCETCMKTSKVKKYVYLITFTLDPKKHPDITDKLCLDVEDYIKKQPSRTALHVKEFHYVKEFHKNGRPHWHCCVTTSKAIRSDAFRQYSRVYGNVDISKNKHTNDSDILAYMSKDSNPVKYQRITTVHLYVCEA